MYFQASEYKRRNFLNLKDDNNQPIHLTYSKDSALLKHFDLFNLICACITRLITNHVPISEYRLRFFSKKSSTYLYKGCPIKIRMYILEFNPETFCFQEGII